MAAEIKYKDKMIPIEAGQSVALHTANKTLTEDVTVTMPDSYIVPSGTLTITENGTHDVTNYASAEVAVESSGDDTYKTQLAGLIDRTATEITFPDGATSIGDYAFAGCQKLVLTSLPAGLTSIGDSAFYNCYGITLTSLPAGLTKIGFQAFYNCIRLALTSLPAGVTSVENYTFYGCNNLALTSLPAGLTKIGNSAFYNCKGLRTLTFEGTPTSIASSAFSSCTNLAVINAPWAEGAVSGAPWGATNATINYNYTGE